MPMRFLVSDLIRGFPMNVQYDYPRMMLQTTVRISTTTCWDERRSQTFDDELARRAIVEQGIRALERQREFARRQGLARYD